VAKYFPPYLASACLYLALAAMIHLAVRTGSIPRQQGSDIEGTGPH
jgi:hypothetical protein